MSGAAATTAVQAAAPYWRTAGMTYLSYANTCAALVRNCLKEPFKTKALQREHAYYKVQPYVDGTPQKSGVCVCIFISLSEIYSHLDKSGVLKSCICDFGLCSGA